MRLVLALLLLSTNALSEELLSEEVIAGRAPRAEEAGAFADALFERGDFYRAIGEYERALFLAPTSTAAPAWSLQIARGYLRGEQFAEAAKAFERVARTYEGGTRAAAFLGAARAFLAQGSNESATSSAQQAAEAFGEGSPGGREARYVEAWAHLQAGRDREAKAAFELARGQAEGDEIATGAGKLLQVFPQLGTLPSANPLLAGALGLVPGLGHLYLGDPATAMSALVWNGLFIWALVDQSMKEEWSLVVVLSLFEAMWYGGSIVGAVSGAHRFNRDARHNALDDLNRISPRDLGGDISTKVTRQEEPPRSFAITLPF